MSGQQLSVDGSGRCGVVFYGPTRRSAAHLSFSVSTKERWPLSSNMDTATAVRLRAGRVPPPLTSY